MTQEQKAIEFQQKKEEEHQSKFIASTFAYYLPKYPDEQIKTGGVLYIMESGIYFENFESAMTLQKLLFQSQKKSFEKIELKFLRSTIEAVGIYPQADNGASSLKKIWHTFLYGTKKGMILTIAEKDGQSKNYVFETLDNPSSFLKKYENVK
ncbi:MAG: hypothetical protein MJB14_07955 [Spirochaetes bacterium]|nr:hypothetical protein [Spirochaetota bacterium]